MSSAPPLEGRAFPLTINLVLNALPRTFWLPWISPNKSFTAGNETKFSFSSALTLEP
jgi:hypothetical protein